MTQPETEPFTKSLERMNLFREPEARGLIADLDLPEGSRGLSGRTCWSAGRRFPPPRATTSSTSSSSATGARAGAIAWPPTTGRGAPPSARRSATFVLDDPDYYCLYPISVLVARR